MLKETILVEVEKAIEDTNNSKWTDADIIGFIDDVQRLIVTLKPSANVITEPFALTAGARQVLTSTGLTYTPVRLINVHCNFGNATTSRGKQILPIKRSQLYNLDQNWMAASASGTVDFFDYDPRERCVFYNYPPIGTATTIKVEVSYSALTATLNTATTTQALGLSDEYKQALIQGVLWKIYEYDAPTMSDGGQRAQNHKKQFLELLGIQSEAENTINVEELSNK